jgi:predicted nucleic acid-binding protein
MAYHKNLYIPDSSILIKWIKQKEEFAEISLQFRKDFETTHLDVHTPFISDWELANFFGRNYGAAEAQAILHQFKSYQFKNHALTNQSTAIALQIMESAKKISFYDASYHALAIELGGTFITCDSKYLEKVKDWGHIMHLKDYPVSK